MWWDQCESLQIRLVEWVGLVRAVCDAVPSGGLESVGFGIVWSSGCRIFRVFWSAEWVPEVVGWFLLVGFRLLMVLIPVSQLSAIFPLLVFDLHEFHKNPERGHFCGRMSVESGEGGSRIWGKCGNLYGRGGTGIRGGCGL